MRYTKVTIFLLILLQIACIAPLATVGSPANTPLPTVSPTLPTVANTPFLEATVTATRSLNVRENAGIHERVVGARYYGDTVILTGSCHSGWAEIVWEDSTAWVNALYISDKRCRNE